MRRGATNLLLGVGLVVALGLAAGSGWLAHEASAPPPPPPFGPPGWAAADSIGARVDRVRAVFERLPDVPSDAENALRRPRTPSYTDHLEMADSLGVPPIEDEDALARALRSGRLVPLADTDAYTVRTLEHSKPFVTPRTRDLVDEVGRRFQAGLAARGLPPYRFSVSSALRTADLQRDLGRINRNATSGRSSHEYGVSVDIVYTRYTLRPSAADTSRAVPSSPDDPTADRWATEWVADLGNAYWQKLYTVLVEVLNEVQREDRALVLLEAEQPVFHITDAVPPEDG